MKIMFLLATFLSPLCIFSVECQGRTGFMEGTLRRSPNAVYLDVSNSLPWPQKDSFEIIFPQPEVKQVLDQLGTGDVVAVQAETFRRSINILHIVSVGLKDLLGEWVTPTSTFYFLSFSEMIIADRTRRTQKVKYALIPSIELPTDNLGYPSQKSVNPNEWQIVMLTPNIQVGWIELNGERGKTVDFSLNLVDEASGDGSLILPMLTTELNPVKKP